MLFFVGGTAGIPVQRPGMADPGADSGLFGMMKGGAGSLFKNLKDTSTKMAATVAK